jgi:hypothetical protein
MRSPDSSPLVAVLSVVGRIAEIPSARVDGLGLNSCGSDRDRRPGMNEVSDSHAVAPI